LVIVFVFVTRSSLRIISCAMMGQSAGIAAKSSKRKLQGKRFFSVFKKKRFLNLLFLLLKQKRIFFPEVSF